MAKWLVGVAVLLSCITTVGCGGGVSRDPSVNLSQVASGLLGDLDGDGAPGVTDAIAILRIVVGLDADNVCADANGDGTTGVGDAIKLLRCVVGFDTWPIGECARTRYVYTAIEYVIEDPWRRTIVLRSRGTGSGTADAFFDAYIEHPDGSGVTALRGDPVWFEYAMEMEQALEQTSPTAGRKGEFVSAGGIYYLDIDGGSDMGGRSYRFTTAGEWTEPTAAAGCRVGALGTDAIEVRTYGRGRVTDELARATNDHGATFWHDGHWVVNATWGHMYFWHIADGRPLNVYTSTVFGGVGPTGGVHSRHGYNIRRNEYTYSIAQAPGGGPTDLGSSNISEFSIQYTDGTPPDLDHLELVFDPAVVAEQPPG